MALDHSRSRSDSFSSPLKVVEAPVPGINTSFGSLTVRPAAFWKFSTSVSVTADWPMIAMDWPPPLLLAAYSGLMSYTVAISPGAKKTLLLTLEVNALRGREFLFTTAWDLGRKSSRLRIDKMAGASAAGTVNSEEAAKCCSPLIL